MNIPSTSKIKFLWQKGLPEKDIEKLIALATHDRSAKSCSRNDRFEHFSERQVTAREFSFTINDHLQNLVPGKIYFAKAFGLSRRYTPVNSTPNNIFIRQAFHHLIKTFSKTLPL